MSTQTMERPSNVVSLRRSTNLSNTATTASRGRDPAIDALQLLQLQLDTRSKMQEKMLDEILHAISVIKQTQATHTTAYPTLPADLPAITGKVATTSIICVTSEQWNTTENFITMTRAAQALDWDQIAVLPYNVANNEKENTPATSEPSDVAKLLHVVALALIVVSATSIIGWLTGVSQMAALSPFAALLSMIASPFVLLMGKAASED